MRTSAHTFASTLEPFRRLMEMERQKLLEEKKRLEANLAQVLPLRGPLCPVSIETCGTNFTSIRSPTDGSIANVGLG
eukprot:COSAG02_NODE_1360_length_13055_cov_9.008567_2_plen_77_part_00